MVENLKSILLFQHSSLAVKVALYHGPTELCAPFTTSAKLRGERINWNETVTFPIEQKDLPKVKVIYSYLQALSARPVSQWEEG